MLQSGFMQQAFIVGGLISLIIPMVGLINVLQHRSLIGDALSHVSLAGITIGLLLGYNPLIGAVCLSIFAAISIEYIQVKLGRYQDMAVAILLSFGIGLAGVLMRFLDNPTNFNSYLFGSIVAINPLDNYLAMGLSVVIIITFLFFYRSLMYVSFDRTSAILSGVNVQKTQWITALLTAITVAVASRIVGALVVSSLMVIPIAGGLQFNTSYKRTLLLGMVYSIISVWLGLSISYYGNLTPGGTIVLVSVFLLLVTLIIKGLKQSRK